ncbi:MAG TPA: alkaline phosphatase [Deltaproteobacteria bacterium]|nr:MAG: alkaline phosphatase [Deltaproteobacteria bacterium GWA2_45_12]HBF12866.1 alkaline phosphatase [Deltaproteobacteria bacterium]
MIEKIISVLATFIIAVISGMGYWGIFLSMAIESACIPLPSEIIMPFSGYLVSIGQFTLHGVAFAGALGCVFGSIVAYYAGLWLGRDFLMKYGKYILVSPRDIQWADCWFLKYGGWAIFFSRLLPVIRTFISFPAGVVRMKMVPFVVYTFIGSYPWCYGLAWVGKKMGDNWNTLGPYFHKFDFVIGILLLIGVGFWVKHHLMGRDPAMRGPYR